MKIKLPSGDECFIDPTDYERVKGWRFYGRKNRHVKYVVMWVWDNTRKRQVEQYLHRFILNAPPNVMVCHLDGNGLNCRRKNLAFGSHRTNGSSHRTKRAGAASKYRGVHVNNGRGKKWIAMFWDNGKIVYLGKFTCQIAAAKAYDKEAKKRFGKFAHLNFRVHGRWEE